MYCNCLSESCRFEVLSIIELCLNLHSEDEFECILKKTRALIGHEMMACGIGIRDGGSMKAVSNLNDGFPEEFISALVDSSGRVVSPLFVRWLESQSPQVLDVNDKPCLDSSGEVAFYQGFSINNVMSHGVLDYGQGYASYFGFANIAGGIEDRHVNLMQILVPHLHTAYMQVEKPQVSATIATSLESDTKILSPRETDVIKWLSVGKTNWEIAQVLRISDQTVKKHVQRIMKKLDANNRQHAVTTALRMKIIGIQ